MNVLSLFDGMSCGRIALERAGLPITNYYASEIDKYAIQVSKANYPDVIHVGDVEKLSSKHLPEIDLLIGGSPCQGFSRSGKGLNFEDSRSKLFFEYVRLLKECKPKYFLLENVKMKKEWVDVISSYLGVEPIRINSSLVSAQLRDRYYWTNIPGIKNPPDMNIMLSSILESGDVDRDKSYCLGSTYFDGVDVRTYINRSQKQLVWKIPEATKKGYIEVSNGDCIDLTFIKSKTRRGRLMLNKSNCLTAAMGKYCKVTNDWFRMLTPTECERLQTVPEGYTDHVSNTQRYKMLGNGWTIDVISHILKNVQGFYRPGPTIRQKNIFDYA